MKDYKKILEGVVNIINTTEKSDIGFANICTYIGENCPELAESEDERIVKELLTFFRESMHGGHILTNKEYDSWIAWLEKQGNNMGISEATKKKLEDNLNKALEKETPESCNKFLDEQGEQNPADKVEPKFKAGDWIITNKNHIWYVDETPETTSYLYRLINQYGKIKVAEFEVVDKKARLWTIQDTKDGDVLACPNDAGDRDVVFIFKNINSDEGWVFCFCVLIPLVV